MTTREQELADIVADLRERARYYASRTRLGVLLQPPPAVAAAVVASARGRSLPDPAPAPAVAPPGPVAKGPSLAQVREELGECQRCPLAATRRTIVFGQGNPDARLMFVGEAPGHDEDVQGLAFVGKAGQLLTRIIEAIGMRREDVYIANVIKCRPPGNRNPEPKEIEACQPFLDSQIQAIRPEVIVGLGKFAGQWLLRTAEPISRIRGRLGERDGIRVMPTYHPAYLLRNPGAKKDVWQDMQIVRDLLRS